MEILNCEYKNNNLEIKKDKVNLGSIVGDIQVNFYQLDEDLEKFYILENMKIFANRSKSVGKIWNPNMEKAELIKNIVLQSNPGIPSNINLEIENKKIRVDYFCIKSISNDIIRLLKTIVDKKDYQKILVELIEQSNLNRSIDDKKKDSSLYLKQISDKFNNVEEISFELSDKKDENFEINNILLFYFFYKLLFPKVNSIIINLDLIQLSEKYNQLKNPYNFKDDKIKEFAENFKNIIFANFLVTCAIMLSNETLAKLKIEASESYINEINYIINKQCKNKNYTEKIMKENGLILFKKLMKIKNINNLSLSINCLDRFLFNELISFITLNRNMQILELNLFYNPKFFIMRKIYLNYLKGQDYYEIDPNIMDKYAIVYFPYIETLEKDIPSRVEEEKIPDLIFPEFKKNLNILKMILNEYIISFCEFSLDISPYDELSKYENYNVEIILFIFSILLFLEKSKNIKTLRLKCSNIDYNLVSLILKKINKLISLKLIDFSGCEKLSNLSLEIQGISLILNFSKLPFNSLEKLDLSISALKDIEKLDEFFKEHKDDLKNLTQLNLSFPFVYDFDNSTKSFIKIFDNLPPNLKILTINNENMMQKEDILEIIKKIQNNKISLNCELKCECFELEEFLNDNKIEDLKVFLNSNGNINIEKLEIIKDTIGGIKFSYFVSPNQEILK